MNAHQTPALLRFACDSIPDCAGQIIARIGDFVILEGMAADSGSWFARGPGGPRKFNSRQEAADYIEYAQDAAGGRGGSGISDAIEQLKREMREAEQKGDTKQAKFIREEIARMQREAQDEPIAADPEEVKKAWRSASTAAQKSNKEEKRKEFKQDYSHDSEERELLYEPEAKAAAQREKDAFPKREAKKPAKDCDATDAPSLEQLRAQATEISDEIDRQVNAGARITLTDPLSVRLRRVREQINRLKNGRDSAQDASDPKDILHQIEGTYRNMDVPTISSERKKVIAIMDNAANAPAIRSAATDLLRRMNREEDKMHGDGAMDSQWHVNMEHTGKGNAVMKGARRGVRIEASSKQEAISKAEKDNPGYAAESAEEK